MAAAYEVNDFVRYATNGICQISDIATMEADGRKDAKFYVLKPVREPATTLYVPTENSNLTSRMGRVLSKTELDSLIVSSRDGGICWPEDRKARNESFREILKTCDQQELLGLIGCIYLKRSELLETGKKLSSSDEGVLKQAERLIQSDFAFVLDIQENEVGDYIRALLNQADEA